MKFIVLSLVLIHVLIEHAIGADKNNFTESIEKALRGFRVKMRKGDEKLGYEIMDPLQQVNLTHKYDQLGHERLHFTFEDAVFDGLSKYEIESVVANETNLTATINLIFENVELEGPYQLDGFTLKGLLPLYGNGHLNYTIQQLHSKIFLHMTENNSSKIVVQEVNVLTSYKKLDVAVTNLLGLPMEFVRLPLLDLAPRLKATLFDDWIQSFAKKLIENNIGGKTREELSDFLDYLGSAAE